MKNLFRVLPLLALMLVLTACPSPATPAASDKDAPKIPEGLSAQAGNESLDLSWTANTESDLESYTLYWGNEENKLEQSKAVTKDVTVTSLASLANDSVYFVAISATDAAGNESEKSATVVATPFAPDVSAPKWLSSSPTQAATDVMVDTQISMVFSEAMDVGSFSVTTNPAVQLAQPSWSEDKTTVTLQALADFAFNTKYSFSFDVSDSSGNALTSQTLSFTTLDVPDTQAPMVLTASPSTGSSGISPSTNLSLSFSEAMDKASVEAAFSTSPAVTCNYLWNAASTLLTCDPVTDLSFDASYSATLTTTAKDAAGNTLASDYKFAFTTASAPDTTAPTLSSSSPANAVNAVSRFETITVTFSEAMDKASAQAAFSITKPAGFNSGVFSWNDAGTQMTYNPDAIFDYGQEVDWQLSTAAKDLAGNALSSSVASSYKVIRQKTVQIFSTASLDGYVYNNGNIFDTLERLVVGDVANNSSVRGLLNFDLSVLPADLTEISTATLYVYQNSVIGDPYSELRSGSTKGLRYEHVNYGSSIDAADYDRAALSVDCKDLTDNATDEFFCGLSFIAPIVSANADLGTKSTIVTYKVLDDWQNRSARSDRSQFRLKFPKSVSADANADYSFILSGDSAANKPYIEVTYEYP